MYLKYAINLHDNMAKGVRFYDVVFYTGCWTDTEHMVEDVDSLQKQKLTIIIFCL